MNKLEIIIGIIELICAITLYYLSRSDILAIFYFVRGGYNLGKGLYKN